MFNEGLDTGMLQYHTLELICSVRYPIREVSDISKKEIDCGLLPTSVFKCFSYSVTETIQLVDLFQTRNATTMPHSLSLKPVRELSLQDNPIPVLFAHCLAEHKLIEDLIF